MQNYKLTVLGQDLSFKADADEARLTQASQMLEDRFRILHEHGKNINREKLLVFLAFALADDLLSAQNEKDRISKKIQSIMMQIETGS